MGRKKEYDRKAAIEYLKKNGSVTAKDLAVDVFGIDPKKGASWGCHILNRLASEGRVRKITKGRPGSGHAALWALVPDEEYHPPKELFKPAYPQDNKPCYVQNGVEVHRYGRGLRVCNCGKMGG